MNWGKSLGGSLLLKAKQVLTMVPRSDAIREQPRAGDLNALRDRDADIAGLLEDAVVHIQDGQIVSVGPMGDIGRAVRKRATVVECGVVVPGFIDCHTHSVFAGSRHAEFTLRNLGADYLEILESGGGILSTVEATREARKRDLAASLVERCLEATRRGITTLEVKSGYGLSEDHELKQLRAIQMAKDEVLVDLQPTFLGAHVVPLSHRERRGDYVDALANEMIPKVAELGLARFVDVFCDKGAFDAGESRRILQAGIDHGLIPRLHADELTHAGAAELAADMGAASADHLEFISDEAIGAMANAGVVAVLLPGVNLCLGIEKFAPARSLLMAGVDVALATDFNPGTSPIQDIGLILTLGCTGYGMTPGEAIRAVTSSAARALRLDDRGVLAPGMRADVTVLGIDDYWQLPYLAGRNHVEGVIQNGELVYWLSDGEIEA
jgi:imidazolonepropionase